MLDESQATNEDVTVDIPSLLKPNTRFNTMTLEALLGKIASGDIDLDPPYQRNDVWNEKSQTRLIQSIALGMFIPEVLFRENIDEVLEAVDGKQRMTSIKRFFDGEIPIRFEKWVREEYPEIYRYYNNKYFTKSYNPTEERLVLTKKERRHFLNYPLRYSYLEKCARKTILDRTFNIVNTSSVKLTGEENMNGEHNGAFLDIFHTIAKADIIDKTLPVSLERLLGEVKIKRMKYVTLFARFIYLTDKHNINPFSATTYSKSTIESKSVAEFLSAKKREFAGLSEEELIVQKAKYRKMIVGALRRCYETFGETVFATNKNTPSQTNNSLFEVLMLGFNKTTGDIQLCKTELATKLNELLGAKGEFFQNISIRGTDGIRMRQRNDTWFSIVRECMAELEPRQTFPPELKNQLFTYGMNCRWCNTEIHDVKTAHIDHILSLKDGGSNSRSNLQLLHKTCNLRKQALSMSREESCAA